MQSLLLAEHVYDQLETGKRVTIRKGRRDIFLGPLAFASTNNNRTQIVEVDMVYYCKLKLVLPSDYINDGFNDIDHMFQEMKKFYPDISMDSEVSVVRFKCESDEQ
jgi:hypothetical protein